MARCAPFGLICARLRLDRRVTRSTLVSSAVARNDRSCLTSVRCKTLCVTTRPSHRLRRFRIRLASKCRCSTTRPADKARSTRSTTRTSSTPLGWTTITTSLGRTGSQRLRARRQARRFLARRLGPEARRPAWLIFMPPVRRTWPAATPRHRTAVQSCVDVEACSVADWPGHCPAADARAPTRPTRRPQRCRSALRQLRRCGTTRGAAWSELYELDRRSRLACGPLATKVVACLQSAHV